VIGLVGLCCKPQPLVIIIIINNNASLIIMVIVITLSGYWHQSADAKLGNPPPTVTRSYLWSKTKLEDPR